MKLIIAVLGVLAVIATLTGDANANPVASPEVQVCYYYLQVKLETKSIFRIFFYLGEENLLVLDNM